MLIEIWKQKNEQTKLLSQKMDEELNQINSSESLGLQSLIQEGNSIATVRKNDIFGSEVTEEEQNIIKQRIAQQQKQFQEYERRELNKKVNKIQSVHPHVTYEEAVQALKECKQDEEEVCVYLTDYFNLQNIRKIIALQHKSNNLIDRKDLFKEKDKQYNEEDDEKFVSRKRKKKKSNPRKNRKSSNSKEGSTYATNPPTKLRLDDALAQGNFEGWSEARIRAYQLRDQNPNAYYYRFNEPGEKQRNGKWTPHEVELFFKRMKEVGVNGQWGIFSRAIPGRVGYQCSNFYRQLIESGKVHDPNYVVDSNGKLRYLFRGKRKTSGEDNENHFNHKHEKPKKKKKKKNKLETEEDEELDDDDEYKPYNIKINDAENNENDNDPTNPLPNFIDPITLCPVVKPAISPYGHVMGYATWSRCLSQEPRNICPFTKKIVKKRDLVILTWENINEYKDKIVNLPKENQ